MSSRYLEIGAIDRLEVKPESIDILIKQDSIAVRPTYTEVGENSQYMLVPFNSMYSTEYTLPASITGSLEDIGKIKSDLLTKLDGKEVAAINEKGYKDVLGYNPKTDGSLREQLLYKVSADYVSNGADGAEFILDLDHTQAKIGTAYDDQGNVIYGESSFLDVVNQVSASLKGQASILEAKEVISSWEQAYASQVTKLTAEYEDVKVAVTDQAYAFSGNSTKIDWLRRGDIDSEGLRVAKGGDITIDPNNVWYLYVGGTFSYNPGSEIDRGWVEYEGSTAKKTALGTAKLHESNTKPDPKTVKVNLYDLWVDNNTTSSFVTDRKAVFEYKYPTANHTSLDWVEIHPDQPTANWLGGFSRLITGPDGSVTGFSAVNGNGIENAFRINANNFEIADGLNKHKPFTINTATNEITFDGKVEFSHLKDKDGEPLTNKSTTIDGSNIITGTLNSFNTVVDPEGSTRSVSKYDLDNGTIEIRDSNGRVRVKLGKLI